MILSTMLCGIHLQNVFVATGCGGNGKSMLHELVLKMLGNFGYVMPSSCLTKPIEDKPNPALANNHKRRGVLSSEPDPKHRICSAMVKQFTGNNQIPVRTIYSKDTFTKMNNTFLLECNSIPLWDEILKAVVRRVRTVPFVAEFLDKEDYELRKTEPNVYPKNTYYTGDVWKDSMVCVLFDLLLPYIKKFIENDTQLPSPPDACKELAKEYLQDCDSFFGWFGDRYEPSATDYVPFSDIHEEYKMSPLWETLSKQDKRHNLNQKNFYKMIRENTFLVQYVKEPKARFGKKQLTTPAICGWRMKPHPCSVSTFNNPDHIDDDDVEFVEA